MAIIVTQIVALSPTPLEESQSPAASLEPEELVESEGGTLASGIPTDRIPDYSVEKFNYVSTRAGQKQWRLVAERAFLYNKEKLVHARNVTAYIYDAGGKTTVVTGLEAKYFMDQRDLEVFGKVVTTFPDGFVTESPYLRYLPAIRRIDIPPKYPVHGKGNAPDGGQGIEFDSHGLDFAMADSEITLPRAVRFVLTPKNEKQPPQNGPRETTTIESDRCVILRDRSLARFSMDAATAVERRFVRIFQPTMDSRSRRAELNYGTGPTGGRALQYLLLFQDVLVLSLIHI